MCSGVSEERSRVTVNPAVGKTRSEGVEVIGIVRNLLATLEILGNLCWFSLHHTKGEFSRSIGLSFKYISTSFNTGSESNSLSPPALV